MYNEEIKKNYIGESIDRNPNLSVYGERIFNQISSLEEQLNKDCCEFTINEIIMFYQSKCSASIESLNVLNSMLRNYTNWCLNKNMIRDNQNHYNEVTLDLMNQCLNYGLIMDKIITKRDLIFATKELDNPSDKALVLALFEGICGDNMCELVNLHYEDIKGHTVKLCSGREFEISDELKKLCLESQETYSRTMRNGIERELQPTDTGVFKNIVCKSSNPVNRKTLYNRLMSIKNEIGLTYLTTYSLMESGRIETIRNIIMETDLTLDQILISRETEYRYGKIPSISNWKRKYEEYV